MMLQIFVNIDDLLNYIRLKVLQPFQDFSLFFDLPISFLCYQIILLFQEFVILAYIYLLY